MTDTLDRFGGHDTDGIPRIPWADRYDEINPLEVKYGTSAVVPNNEGEFDVLDYYTYMRELGKAAYTSIDGEQHYVDADFNLKPWWTIRERGEA